MPCSGPKDCGEFTLSDQLGPFFVENVTNSLELAPEAELEDVDKAVVLRGEVLDRGCRGVAGATIDVWYGAREDQHGEKHYRDSKISIHHIYFYALCAR